MQAQNQSTAPDVFVDVIVVGGGAAGLTAALVLARARRRVLVVDDLTHRNATVDEFHGFPTRDTTSPANFRSEARRELHSYGVTFSSSTVTGGCRTDDEVAIAFADGAVARTRVVVIATGVRDELPPIDGLAARWGKSVFNCPFCDGWEHRDQAVAVIDAAPGADHLATMVRAWTSHVTVLSAGNVARLVGSGSTLERIELHDGSSLCVAAAFLRAPVHPRSELARQLGCATDDAGYIRTDESGKTSQPNVWAAGDIRRPPPQPHQVILAAADGSTAAIAIHKHLVETSSERC